MDIKEKGTVKAVCISESKGTVKTAVPVITMKEGFGIEHDAHAGSWHRQVSVLGLSSVEAFEKESEVKVEAGAFGENILVEGFDPSKLRPGSTVSIGDAVLEITQIGKECHTSCKIRQMTGKCIMPVYGVFAEVKHGGEVKPGDKIEVKDPDPKRPFQAAVITVSDKGAAGIREDKSGPLMEQMLKDSGYEVREKVIIPDEKKMIKREITRLSDKRGMDLILTSGGTGFSHRDVTPEATEEVIERKVPGIPEALRMHSMQFTDHALLSRQTAGIRGSSLIVNLPGSPKAVREDLEYILPKIEHGLRILRDTVYECGGNDNA